MIYSAFVCLSLLSTAISLNGVVTPLTSSIAMPSVPSSSHSSKKGPFPVSLRGSFSSLPSKRSSVSIACSNSSSLPLLSQDDDILSCRTNKADRFSLDENADVRLTNDLELILDSEKVLLSGIWKTIDQFDTLWLFLNNLIPKALIVVEKDHTELDRCIRVSEKLLRQFFESDFAILNSVLYAAASSIKGSLFMDHGLSLKSFKEIMQDAEARMALTNALYKRMMHVIALKEKENDESVPTYKEKQESLLNELTNSKEMVNAYKTLSKEERRDAFLVAYVKTCITLVL